MALPEKYFISIVIPHYICSQTINTDDLVDDNLCHRKVLLAFSRMQSGFLHYGTEILQLCCNCVVCLIHHIASKESSPW